MKSVSTPNNEMITNINGVPLSPISYISIREELFINEKVKLKIKIPYIILGGIMKLFFRILLISCCILMFYLSHQSGEQSLETSVIVSETLENSFDIEEDILNNILRNFAHFIEYFILSSLIYINLRISNRKTEYVIILVFLVSVFDEIYQSFIPGRVMSVYDLMIDNLGNIMSYILMCILFKLKRRTI